MFPITLASTHSWEITAPRPSKAATGIEAPVPRLWHTGTSDSGPTHTPPDRSCNGWQATKLVTVRTGV